MRALAFAVALTIVPFAALAQTPAKPAAPKPAAGWEAACPLTLDITYGGVKSAFNDQMPPEDKKKFDVAGFETRFDRTTVRLIEADVAGHPVDGDVMSGMADNAESRKPGQPLVYTLREKNEKLTESRSNVQCRYEGGLALMRPVPKEMISCANRQTLTKAPAAERTTREFISQANFTCK